MESELRLDLKHGYTLTIADIVSAMEKEYNRYKDLTVKGILPRKTALDHVHGALHALLNLVSWLAIDAGEQETFPTYNKILAERLTSLVLQSFDEYEYVPQKKGTE